MAAPGGAALLVLLGVINITINKKGGSKSAPWPTVILPRDHSETQRLHD